MFVDFNFLSYWSILLTVILRLLRRLKVGYSLDARIWNFQNPRFILSWNYTELLLQWRSEKSSYNLVIFLSLFQLPNFKQVLFYFFVPFLSWYLSLHIRRWWNEFASCHRWWCWQQSFSWWLSLKVFSHRTEWAKCEALVESCDHYWGLSPISRLPWSMSPEPAKNPFLSLLTWVMDLSSLSTIQLSTLGLNWLHSFLSHQSPGN